MDKNNEALCAVEESSLSAWIISQNNKLIQRLLTVIVVMAILWALSLSFAVGSAAWERAQYDYAATSMEIKAEQDGNGINIVGGGDVSNGAEGIRTHNDQDADEKVNVE